MQRVKLAEFSLDRLLAQHRLIRQPHPIGREHAGERVDEHRVHAQLVRHQAGVLAPGAAEALQGEPGRVVPLLQRHLLDRVGHVGDGDAKEALRHGACILVRHQGGEPLPHDRGVQRLVARRAEDRREMRRLDLADHHIRIGDGQRTAPAVAGRPGIGAGAVRPDLVARPIEMQHRTAAGRHRVDRHHRRPDPHAGDRGLERPLERAVVEGDVGGGAPHVEPDDPLDAGRLCRARRPDDAARRTGQDGVLAAERRSVGEAAAGLHEVQLHAG